MGCLYSLFKFLLLLWAVNLAWRYLIAPLFGLNAASTPRSRTDYIRAFVPLLAKMAKADGRVTEREIARIEAIFRDNRFTDEERALAVRVFTESKDSPEDFETLARRFAFTVRSFEARLVTFQYLILVAAADGTLSAAERELIAIAAVAFGIPAGLARQILNTMVGGSSGRAGGYGGHSGGYRPPPREEHSRADDLALLGLPPNATESDIRKAYRQKAKELHPDRLQAQGLPEAMLKQASERMAAINAAYARLIKKG